MSSNTSIIDKSSKNIEIEENEKSIVSNVSNVSQNKMVRTDYSEQKIDKFLNTSNSNMLTLSKSNTDETITW